MTTLDTHAVVKDLQAAGFDERQAEAVSRVMREAVGASHFATKADLENVNLSLKAEVVTQAASNRSEVMGLRSDISAEFANVRGDTSAMKADVLKWMIGAIGFQTLVMAGAVIALVGLGRP